jgi:hypothetical protein
MRKEIFGSIGVMNIREFVDPKNPSRVAVMMDVPDLKAFQALMGTQVVAESLVILVEEGGGRLEETGGDWRRLEETGGDWRRLEETGGDWRRLEETGAERDGQELFAMCPEGGRRGGGIKAGRKVGRDGFGPPTFPPGCAVRRRRG